MPPSQDPKSRIPQLRSADIDEMPANSGVFASLWAKFRAAAALTWPWSKIEGAPSNLPPSGPAGGVLSGNYPDPGFAVNMAEQSELDAETQTREDADVALGNAVQAVADDLGEHEERTDNPHGVTAAQVGAETTAQLNARDVANRARANHTGTQSITTVSGLSDALDGLSQAIEDEETARESAIATRAPMPGANGIIVRTGASTTAARSIAVTGLATVSNASGAAGNPTVGVPAASDAQAITGTSTTLAMTPAADKAALDAGVARTLEGAGLLCDRDSAQSATITTDAVGTGDFTIFGWGFRSVAGELYGVVSGSGPNATLNISGTGEIQFYDGTTNHVSGIFLPEATWSFFGVRRSAGVMQFSLNAAPWSGAGSSAVSLAGFTTFGSDRNVFHHWRGRLARVSIANFALSNAQIADVFARLGLVPREWWGGSMDNLVPAGDSRTFATGLGQWGTTGSGEAANAVGGNAVVTTTIGTSLGLWLNWYGTPAFSTVAGRKYRAAFTLSGVTGGNVLLAVTAPGGLSSRVGSAAGYGNGTHVVDFVAPADRSVGDIGFVTQTHDTFSLGCTGFALAAPSVLNVGALYLQPDSDQGAGPVLRAPSGPHTLLPGDGHETGGVVRGNPLAIESEIGPFPLLTGLSVLGAADVRRVPAGYAVTSVRAYIPAGSTGSFALGSGASHPVLVSILDYPTLIVGHQTFAVAQPFVPSPERVWLAADATIAGGALLWLRIAPIR